MPKKTKIICTLGPSTDNAGVLESLLAAGMNVARFNFSHGTHEDQARRVGMIRAAEKKTGIIAALMLDTKGPEMRIGKFEAEKVSLRQGQKFTLTTRNVNGTAEIVSVSYNNFTQDVAVGNTVLLSDGVVSLQVEAIEGEDVITEVLNDAEISSYKRVAVPGVSLQLPFLSEQDVKDILFGVKHNMDFIAASFVQRAADILAIRRVLEEAGAAMDIIAKIENAQGVENIDEILKVADGVMVARGDLGVEIPTEEVPLVQKMLIEKCNKAGKPVITATQMLESMINNPRPTRAEASDVANAIIDGSDAIMLSGETAAGQYPLEATQTMAKIAKRTEEGLNYSNILLNKGFDVQCTTTGAISHATVQIAHELGAAAILTSTETGYTARMISQYRPKSAIVAVTPREKSIRRMQLLWGVNPVMGPVSPNSDTMVINAIQASLIAGIVKEGDLVIITAGVPAGTSGTTNMIRVHVVGNILLRGTGVGQHVATGKVVVVKTLEDIEKKFHPGDVMVLAELDEDFAPYAMKASAIVSEESGLTSLAAIIAISYGLPAVVGVDKATGELQDGAIVTVDAARGVIFQGQINAR